MSGFIQENPCKGCSVLLRDLPFVCQIDYQKTLNPVDVLFVADSYTPDIYYPAVYEDSDVAQDIIAKYCKDLGIKYSLVSASKCPTKDLEKDDIKICRKYLIEDVNRSKPSLIITLGELALKFVMNMANLYSKRGSHVGDFMGVPVVPTFCLKESEFDPTIIINDIYIAVNIFIKGNKNKVRLEYNVIKDHTKIKENLDRILEGEKEVAVDIETEGLDFIHHKITTISFSTNVGAIAIPVYHKDASSDPSKVLEEIRPYLEDNTIRKVFHNTDFDWKFLKRAGIHTNNVGDTMLMAFLCNENYPRKLVSLVRRYFPEEIDEI